MKYILTILLLLPLLACEKDPNIELSKDLIVGTWSKMNYTDSAIVLEKVSSLPDDEYGIEFKSNGKLTEWKNSGWCGTPPISYAEFEGSWEFLNDSVLSIESTYWGGTSVMEWQILELNNQTLKHLIIKSENLTEE